MVRLELTLDQAISLRARLVKTYHELNRELDGVTVPITDTELARKWEERQFIRSILELPVMR